MDIPTISVSAFRTTGIIPFKSDIFQDEDFIASMGNELTTENESSTEFVRRIQINGNTLVIRSPDIQIGIVGKEIYLDIGNLY